MGLSIRAYGRHRGVSHVAVLKALEAGRITAEADGTIDAARADREWNQNTVQPRKRAEEDIPTTKQRVEREPLHTREPSPDPVNNNLSTGGTSLLQARTVNEVVKAQTNKVRLARLKGDLVDRTQALAHVFQLARDERDAWLNWPARISAQLAAQLEVDAHTLHLLLETAVREHLLTLGEPNPRVD